MVDDVSRLIAELQAAGGDTTDVEVKSAAGGLPDSLTATMSALANLPGGGTIILGLDERNGFRPVGLADPQALKQGLATKARSYTPPVRLTISDAVVDDEPVVVIRVHECDPSTKPCRVTSTGAAYLRGYDGDFRLSAIEEQGFLAARRPPLFERSTVDGAGPDDLDPELVDSFLEAVRERDPRGLGRFGDDAELLRRAGVTDDGGRPTVAGLLALGVHPQQWFPRYVIQAAESLPAGPAGARARNQIMITGPIPRMIDAAIDWARRTFDTYIVSEADGTVRDQYAFPILAFRELITNALVHRDLDHWSAGYAVEVRVRRDRLVVANPGGLYGITVERLGRDAVTSPRNARLVAMCQHVRSPRTGTRVIEALASGIPTIAAALAEEGLPPAQYIDVGIRFTAILRRPTSAPTTTATAPAITTTAPAMIDPNLNTGELRIFDALAAGARTVAELEADLGMAGPTIRKALRGLRGRGLVKQLGGRGKPTTYHRLAGPGHP